MFGDKKIKELQKNYHGISELFFIWSIIIVLGGTHHSLIIESRNVS